MMLRSIATTLTLVASLNIDEHWANIDFIRTRIEGIGRIGMPTEAQRSTEICHADSGRKRSASAALYTDYQWCKHLCTIVSQDDSVTSNCPHGSVFLCASVGIENMFVQCLNDVEERSDDPLFGRFAQHWRTLFKHGFLRSGLDGLDGYFISTKKAQSWTTKELKIERDDQNTFRCVPL